MMLFVVVLGKPSRNNGYVLAGLALRNRTIKVYIIDSGGL